MKFSGNNGGRIGMVEALEARAFKSATLVDGVLSVAGTWGGDVIAIDQTPGGPLTSVYMDGQVNYFPSNQIGLIAVYGRAGNDDVVIGQEVWIPSILRTGQGDDTISGGSSYDDIYAGAGNDVIAGYFGDDSIIAGGGDDTVYGFWGNDTLDGGAGFNQVFGNDGDDLLIGGDNSEVLDGGDGNDLVSGGYGDDILIGGFGDDTLTGEGGHDYLSAGPGFNFLAGGDGDDTLVAVNDQSDFVDGGGGYNELHVDSAIDSYNVVPGSDIVFDESGYQMLF